MSNKFRKFQPCHSIQSPQWLFIASAAVPSCPSLVPCWWKWNFLRNKTFGPSPRGRHKPILHTHTYAHAFRSVNSLLPWPMPWSIANRASSLGFWFLLFTHPPSRTPGPGIHPTTPLQDHNMERAGWWEQEKFWSNLIREFMRTPKMW